MCDRKGVNAATMCTLGISTKVSALSRETMHQDELLWVSLDGRRMGMTLLMVGVNGDGGVLHWLGLPRT